MKEMFDVDVRTINEHLKNIYKSDELNENSTIRKYRIVQKEGNRNNTDFKPVEFDGFRKQEGLNIIFSVKGYYSFSEYFY
jgi:hypothetical protein